MAQIKTEQSPSAQTDTKRILVVEDEWIVALDLAMSLQDAGYAVVGPAGRVADALKLIDQGDIDAAVLDVNLAGENSKPIAMRLRENGTPFLFLTGYSKKHLDPVLHSEVVLNKPMSQTRLRNALDGLLAAKAS